MIRKLLWLILFVQVSWAQSLYIPYKENIQVDGNKKDWRGHQPILSFVQNNKELSNTVNVFAAWNEQYFHLLYEVKDENLISLTNDSIKTHLNDAVEFFIDPLLDSKDKMDVNDYQFIVGVNNTHTILKGDYRKTDSMDILAPKEHGITTLIFKYQVKLLGKINDHQTDTGYMVEMSIPFSAIGIEPKEGVQFKADFCLDDADSLVDIAPIPDSLEVPSFFYGSWKGSRDFSFPSEWSTFQLKGKPSAFNQFVRVNSRWLLWTLIAVAVVAIVVISLLVLRIRQLKNVPQKSSITTFDSIEQYIHPESVVVEEREQHTDESIHAEKLQEEPEIIKKARNYILLNIEEEIEIDKLSSYCAVSSRQLQRIFKEHLSITPTGFIVVLKMEEAATRLRSGKFNVSEVAYQLGYSDAAYFTRVFKKYFGYPPKNLIG